MRPPRPLRELVAMLGGERPAVRDWTALIALANQTLCSPTLAIRLAAAGHLDAVPAEVRTFLREVGGRNAVRNERLRAQLAEAAASLAAADIAPLLLKGTAWLALAREEELGARVLADLDLLVPPERFHRAIAALETLGYRLQAPAPDPSVPAVLWRSQDAATIDLHSEVGGSAMLGGLAIPDPRERRVALGESVVLVPPGTTQVAILVLHDQLKGRDYLRGRIDLRHLLDIQALVEGFGDADWDELERLFATRYAQHGLRNHLLTARRLLGVPVPDRLVRGLRPALQFQRRMVQARWPATKMAFTMVSLLDPSYLGARRAWRRGAARSEGLGPQPLLPPRQSLRRLFVARESGKM